MHRVNCVIDVGANIGQFAARIRRLGYPGRINSFEPVEESFATLESVSSSDGGWRVFRVALGALEASMEINLTDSSDFSSFFTPNEFGLHRFPNRIRSVGAQRVPMTTLSHVWPELVDGIPQPRVFLKLDTQGFDLEVLRGAESVLQDVVGLQSEISIKPIYENAPDYITSLVEFRARGFEPTGFYLVTRDRRSLAAIEYDCILIRGDSARALS